MSDLKKAFELIEEGFTLLGLTLEAGTSSEAPAKEEAPAGKTKARRRKKKTEGKKKKEAAASGPNIEDARSALMEVVNAFEDGAEAVEELLGEVEKDCKKISDMDPARYQAVIDAAKAYLEESDEE